jgi:hypothetical protein
MRSSWFDWNPFRGLAFKLQKNANETCDTCGPVVSHINNLSMWLFFYLFIFFFFVGDGQYTLHDIWLKSVQGFSRDVQTMWTDNAYDSIGSVVGQDKKNLKHFYIL